MFYGKTQNYLHHGPSKLQNAINEIQSMVIFIVQKEYQTLTKKWSYKRNMKADYPLYVINSVVNEFHKGKECGDESLILVPLCLRLQSLSYLLKYLSIALFIFHLFQERSNPNRFLKRKDPKLRLKNNVIWISKKKLLLFLENSCFLKTSEKCLKDTWKEIL